MAQQDYTILETLHESDKSRVYLASAGQTANKVVLKTLAETGEDTSAALALQNEYAMTQSLNNRLKPHGLTYMDASVAFVRDFLEGTTLAAWMKQHPLPLRPAWFAEQSSLTKRLQIAIAMTREIEILHNQRMIHKDINPSNIIVSENDDKVFVIDYELSSKLDIKAHFLGNPERLEGTLAYLSPEQTGRMNRVVDYRCDLYALGVVLYELFTGQKPFVFEGANSALEYIHAHIARIPVHPAKLTAAHESITHEVTAHEPASQQGIPLPAVMGDIVIKLLAKNAEDRYQSAFRLRKDLEECLRLWLEQGEISSFPVAKHDIPLKFQIPQRLYGREEEHRKLMGCFAKIAAGRKMLTLVSGYSGIGKTALVYDIHVPVTERNALFVSGKFEQFQRNIPFSAWTKAFTEFAELLLTENPVSVNQWKTRILDALGDLAGVITQLVPAMENVLGKQAPPPLIPTNETQNRFNYVLRTFIRAICTKERPLVVFIDDFQWADAASLNLLRVIMSEPGLGYFLVIGAYRDNEVDEAHPFSRAVDDVQKEWSVLNTMDTSDAHAPDNVLVERIILHNLEEQHITTLIADTLQQSRENVAALARLVFDKTSGNAFFVHRFTESLHEQGFIELVTLDGEPQWRYDMGALRDLAATDNVISLLTQKIIKLPQPTQELLRIASVGGRSFSLRMLAMLAQRSVTDTESDLWAAIEEGLLVPEDTSYRFIKGFGENNAAKTRFRFAHDRVRQAVYESIAAEEKERIHKKAALQLLETLDEHETEQQIFEIANHLNAASALVDDKALLCRVNYQAGSRAKLSTAYSTAFSYFERALHSLEPGAWEKNYSFTLNLYDQTSETAFLSGNYDEMERLVAEILAHGQTVLDKVKALEIRTNALFMRQQIVASVQSGLEALEMLGMKLPKKPSQLTVILELLKAKQALKHTSPQELRHLPLMEDRTELAKMRIMATLAPALFFTDPNLFPIMLFRMTVLSVQHGIASASAYAFASFGFVLCGVTGEVQKGIEFGELALYLIEHRPFNEYQARALFVVRYFIDHWHKPMHNNVGQIKEAYRHSLESGEADFTAFLGNGYVVYLILSGTPLTDAEQELMRQLQYITQNKLFTSLTFNNMYHQFVLCLLGKAENPALMQGERYDVIAQEEEYIKTNNQSTLFNQSYFQMQLSLLMGKMQDGMRFAEHAGATRKTVVGTSISLQVLFVDALLRYHNVMNGSSTKRRKDVGAIRSALKQLRKVAVTIQQDFEHKVLCVEACLAALEEKTEKASVLMEQAVKRVRECGNLYDQCFIDLEAYRLSIYLKQQDYALEALQRVLISLQDWNAFAVIEQLKSEPTYRILAARQGSTGASEAASRQQQGQAKEGSIIGSTKNALSNDTVDIYSIIKGTQIITGELNLKNLIGKMLAVMSENAGAQRGVLILEQQEGIFAVQAELLDDGTISTLEPPMRYEQFDHACLAIINYVLHSGVNLVLDNAAADTRFMNDRYIKSGNIRSVLCSKIMVKSKVVGTLYLENNLVTGAFTPSRIEVLNILGAQAAIAIENARYYTYVEEMNRTLEQKVQERTSELAEKNGQLIELNREKSELMGIVAHDLKNPIGAVRGLADLISQQIVEGEAATKVSEQIVSTADRMLDLVTNMLEINRIEEGSFELKLAKFDISSLVEVSVMQYQSPAEAKSIGLHYEISGADFEVFADEQALMQVLENLISNAVKYSPFEKNIVVRLKSLPHTVRVEVADEGPGISAEDKKKLFGKFTRLSAQPTGGENSTGLGLSIVKKLVEAMHGRVWCESELGKGATFIVELLTPKKDV
ncbi:MAG: AAA family ATPase [Candidatus Kapabacteria bacterium]|jgi:predicted ATPase/signal transduction histidine kinase|nr:AAA family ATPase [Candidatus Kapabacteria bacterium]